VIRTEVNQSLSKDHYGKNKLTERNIMSIHDSIRDEVFGKLAELQGKGLIDEEVIYEITSCFDDMPEDWDDVCGCATCRSYAD